MRFVLFLFDFFFECFFFLPVRFLFFFRTVILRFFLFPPTVNFIFLLGDGSARDDSTGDDSTGDDFAGDDSDPEEVSGENHPSGGLSSSEPLIPFDGSSASSPDTSVKADRSNCELKWTLHAPNPKVLAAL